MDHIIHDIPAWCNILFNTNLVNISSHVEVPKYKPVYFLQLIPLIATASTLYLSWIKINTNMENTFNNEVIIPLFGFRIFSVCSIMVRKGNHWIVSFIVVGQYKSLSWRSIYFLSEVLNMLASIFISYASASRLSLHSWSNAGWLVSFNRGTTYEINMLIVILFLSLNYVWI